MLVIYLFTMGLINITPRKEFRYISSYLLKVTFPIVVSCEETSHGAFKALA